MVSFLVIQPHNELRNCFSHGRFGKQDHVVQTRFFEGTNKSLRIGIQVHRAGSFRDSTPALLKVSRNCSVNRDDRSWIRYR